MFTLKPISTSGIKSALEKAKRYRLLNEPRLAESICRDILEIDPDNQEAIVMLLLSLTDQFGNGYSSNMKQARALLPLLSSDYERSYYAGLICERKGKSVIDSDIPDYTHTAYEWFRDAMDYYEEAEALRPPDNDDAILRWNTCVRMISRYKLEARWEEPRHQLLE